METKGTFLGGSRFQVALSHQTRLWGRRAVLKGQIRRGWYAGADAAQNALRGPGF